MDYSTFTNIVQNYKMFNMYNFHLLSHSIDLQAIVVNHKPHTHNNILPEKLK